MHDVYSFHELPLRQNGQQRSTRIITTSIYTQEKLTVTCTFQKVADEKKRQLDYTGPGAFKSHLLK